MTTKRRELSFQNHIIDSYARAGGRAQKWASEWQANKPDLICSLPGIRMHLIEVKHLPDWRTGSRINQLTAGQRNECKLYLDAAAPVWAGIVAGSSDARGSKMALFNPLAAFWHYGDGVWFDYRLGRGFDVDAMIKQAWVTGNAE